MKSIRKYRVKAKLTQHELAMLCGFGGSQSRISNYENGTREPSITDLRTIVKALRKAGVECSLDALAEPCAAENNAAGKTEGLSKLKAAMKLAGVSQLAIAEHLGVSKQAVHMYVAGKRVPRLKSAQKIVAYLNARGANCRIDELFPLNATCLMYPFGRDHHHQGVF